MAPRRIPVDFLEPQGRCTTGSNASSTTRQIRTCAVVSVARKIAARLRYV
jgi:hypothetical protein